MQVIERERRCPHPDIRDCPLYLQSHVGPGGCVYGEWHDGCAIDRGEATYPMLFAKLRWTLRRGFDEMLDRIAERQAREQRERNSKSI